MDLTGKINHGAYSLALNSKDPNANMNLAASGFITKKSYSKSKRSDYQTGSE